MFVWIGSTEGSVGGGPCLFTRELDQGRVSLTLLQIEGISVLALTWRRGKFSINEGMIFNSLHFSAAQILSGCLSYCWGSFQALYTGAVLCHFICICNLSTKESSVTVRAIGDNLLISLRRTHR